MKKKENIGGEQKKNAAKLEGGNNSMSLVAICRIWLKH